MSALTRNKNIQAVLIDDSFSQGLSRYTEVWNLFFRMDTLKLLHMGRQSRRFIMASRKSRVSTYYPTSRYSLRNQQYWSKHANWYWKRSAVFHPYHKKRNSVTNVYVTGLLPRDFRETQIRNNIKAVLIGEKCLSISTPQINYIEPDHDSIDKGNCLRTKYFYKDHHHLVELGNKKMGNTIIKAIKHCNLRLPMNTKKYYTSTQKYIVLWNCSPGAW